MAPNKSVLYAEQTLSEEDTKWATHMKKTIGDLLPKHSLDGAHFARMVETVLSRDKNWVRWKSDSCPPITRPAVTPEAFQEAKATAKRMATNKRLRPTPMGSLPLNFLALEGDQAMGKYRSAMRYKLPELTSFKDKIALDELEIDMPTNNQALAAAIESKASKSWRAMRIAGRCKLAAFDKIDSDDKIDVIFQEGPAQDEEEAEDAEEEGGRTEAKAD